MSENSKEAASLSRRNFLKKGAGIATAGAAVAALAGCAPSGSSNAGGASNSGEDLETKWDVDILIVGAGLAGYSAANRLLDLGMSTDKLLIIDKLSGEPGDFGMSSTFAMGNFLLPSENTDAAKEVYAQTIYKKSGETTNLELLETLGNNAYDALDWLIEKGCTYTELKDYEDGLMQRTMEKPGNLITLREAYEAAGGAAEWDVKVQKINIKGNGVSGVLASNKDGYFNISAQKVIMCTGGYHASPAMRERFIGDAAANIRSRAPYGVTGDGIPIIEAAGGSLAPKSHGIESLYLSCSSVESLTSGHAYRALKYSIAVNSEGKRFCNEGVLDNVAQHHLRQLYNEPGCIMGMLTGASRYEEMNNYESLGRLIEVGVPIYNLNTLEEVADLFKVPADTLKATVEEYNAHVVGDRTEGLNPDKLAMAQVIEAPYMAFYPFVLTTSLAFAGISADKDARVTQDDGTVIPNLYAAGELVGGFFYDLYFGGSQQAKAVVFGRIAGETAYADFTA